MPTGNTAPTRDESLKAAALACAQWGIQAESIEILNESENIVLDIELRSGRHRVMRLHRPGYNTIDELTSEMLWVGALEASGVTVPRALPALDGQFYVAVKVGAQDRYAGVIEWINGAALGGPLENASGHSVDHYGRIGELAGRIRTQSAAWVPPNDFVRRRWDADGLVGDDPIWGRFWEVDTLTTGQRALFRAARRRLREELLDMSTETDRFGMIHADLHLGNLMADGNVLTVIDFDDAGFGWFAHELAVALHSILDTPNFDRARAAIVSGYRRAHRLDDDEVRLIDTFLVIRCLMIVGWLHDRQELPIYELHPELATQAAEVTERYLTSGSV